MSSPTDYPLVTTTLRVRYAETDQMGVVYYANYLVWFEVARAAFCRERGIDYRQMEAEGLFLPVMEARCRYKSPARYEDEIWIEIQPLDVRRRSVQFGYRLFREETLLAEGDTVQVLVSRDGKLRTFPPELLTRFAGER